MGGLGAEGPVGSWMRTDDPKVSMRSRGSKKKSGKRLLGSTGAPAPPSSPLPASERGRQEPGLDHRLHLP